MNRIMVTGGAGFIGSAVCRHLVRDRRCTVLNLDKLTYAAVPGSLKDIEGNSLYRFEKADVCDRAAVSALFTDFQPDAVMHLAAESHVDRSIDNPDAFVETNMVGTFNLLECARAYWRGCSVAQRESFRLHHVSTDEVYGSLGREGRFDENAAYHPRSPYSASKAAGDHLVRAWFHTYGLPVVITNSSNNYGPFQYPEKLIPLVILNALDEKPLPIYGKGDQVRDWMHVDDHARALALVIEKGEPGATYNIGTRNERTNLGIVEVICDLLDELKPRRRGSYRELITFVADRPGHDKRYAIDPAKLETNLGWKAQENFEAALRRTVEWYLDHEWWWRPVREQGLNSRPGAITEQTL